MRPIAISLSPNTEKDDVFVAIKTFLRPDKWFDRGEVELLEKEFAQRFGEGYKALAVNSGRSAEYLIMKVLGVGKGDLVAVQSFTCIAVPNSVLWNQAKPLYIDIDDSLNMDPDDLKKKLTKGVKAIIVQHTFGVPANLDPIRKIAKEKKIYLVEDCAHSLGARYKDKEVGTFGDVSFFSFGRDKVISSVFGGMILCSNEQLYERLKQERDKLKDPSVGWVLQQLFHPIAFSLILPLYNYYIGKILLYSFQKLGLLSKAVYEKEKNGLQPKSVFPTKMPGGLAILARNQLKKLDRFNNHRRKIAAVYMSELKETGFSLPKNKEGSVWLRFPILSSKRDSIFSYLRSKGVLIGDWYKEVLTPSRNLETFDYKLGICSNAEKVSSQILNLPTYPLLTEGDARRVIKLLKEYEVSS